MRGAARKGWDGGRGERARGEKDLDHRQSEAEDEGGTDERADGDDAAENGCKP